MFKLTAILFLFAILFSSISCADEQTTDNRYRRRHHRHDRHHRQDAPGIDGRRDQHRENR